MKVMRYKVQDHDMGRAGTYTVLLVKTGRKFLHVIFMDSAGIKLTKVKVKEHDYMWELDTYPLKAAIKRFKIAGRNFGITHSAKQALKEAT